MAAFFLSNNFSFTLVIKLCGAEHTILKHSRQNIWVDIPPGATMPVEISGAGSSATVNISTGENVAHEQEFDFISHLLRVYQHVESKDGVVTGMTLSFGHLIYTSKWMELLDKSNDLRLSEITIPGSHDSGCWNTTALSRCQAQDILGQLRSGIRWLDLRLAPSGNDLRVWHGIEATDVYLGKDILPAVKKFLEDNKRETVILSVVNVGSEISPQDLAKLSTLGLALSLPDIADHDIFDALLHKILMAGVTQNKLYDQPAIPKLKDVEGCVVLMRQDPEATFGIPAQNWPDDRKDIATCQSARHALASVDYSVQNVYNFGGDVLQAKWREIKSQLQCAQLRMDGPRWYVNYTSASRAGIALLVRIALSLNGPPPSFLMPKGNPVDIAVGDNQEGMNYKLHAYLCKESSPKYFGLIPLDFPEKPSGLMSLLISMNKMNHLTRFNGQPND